MNKNLGDLAACDHTIAGIARLARIALQENQLVLVWTVVIEPAGTHNRVRQAAGAHQPFSTALPIVGLCCLVVVTYAIGDSDSRHQGDPCRP